MEKLTLAEFSKMKREKLLVYEVYSENFDEAEATVDEVMRQLKQSSAAIEKIPLNTLMEVSEGLASESLVHLTNCYSAGHLIADLRIFYPTVIECWEIFAEFSSAYDATEEGRKTFVAHLPLQGSGYYDANRLICFAILLGLPQLIERLIPIIDYKNSVSDGLLERLFLPYISNRASPPDECTRHLPYFKTLKIFKAQPEQRSKLVAKYLEEWYHASRREPYYDSHEKDTSFVGYWSWESAAITFILNIDDMEYKKATFYPWDLVEFARAYSDDKAIKPDARDANGNLRAKSGEICPVTGRWETMNMPVQSKIFKEGEVISDVISAYGLTVWINKGAT